MRPRTHQEMRRVVSELKKLHSYSPGSLADETDAARIATLIHHFDARVLSHDAHRRISHDNPVQFAPADTDSVL